MEKAQELLGGDDLANAFEILIDLYQYDALRIKYEPVLLTGMAYCMTFIHKDYARATEMINLIPEGTLKDLNDFYRGLYDKVKKELEANPLAPSGEPEGKEATPAEEAPK
jgi:hypothetical protein